DGSPRYARDDELGGLRPGDDGSASSSEVSPRIHESCPRATALGTQAFAQALGVPAALDDCTPQEDADMPQELNAIALLRADHEAASRLGQVFERLVEHGASEVETVAEVERICLLQSIHIQVENEVFYPSMRPVMAADAQIDQAQADDWLLGDLIAEVIAMRPSELGYDVKVRALCKAIEHHASQQEAQIFPRAMAAVADLQSIGAEIVQRTAALRAQDLTMGQRLARENEAGDPVGHQ
ncbi:hemerythrin domain-containing protein, partial [Rhodoferax sp.]|uniref:hemerythrin domain-containing protein n=1 Tax=Rhodoferax sp. TaxID=50421 RepID=UPI00274531F4|nr:hemerythrin domain-containing protein [Rhodoferax sp.]